MTKRINPKSLKGGILQGSTVKMPRRFSASIVAMDVGGSSQKVTMLPPRRPLNLQLLGLKKVNG